MKINVTFNSAWVLSRQADRLLPCEWLKSVLNKKYGDKVFNINTDITSLSMELLDTVSNTDDNGNDFSKNAVELIGFVVTSMVKHYKIDMNLDISKIDYMQPVNLGKYGMLTITEAENGKETPNKTHNEAQKDNSKDTQKIKQKKTAMRLQKDIKKKNAKEAQKNQKETEDVGTLEKAAEAKTTESTAAESTAAEIANKVKSEGQDSQKASAATVNKAFNHSSNIGAGVNADINAMSDMVKNTVPAEEVIEKIDSLIGWSEYKKLCHEIMLVAPEIRKHNTYKSFLFQNYLFSVNDGCGLTTALNLFTELIAKLELFKFNSKHPGEDEREQIGAVGPLTNLLSAISSLGGNADNGSNAANTDTSNAGSGPAQSGDNNADSNSLSELNEFLSILNGDDSGNKHSDGKSDGKNSGSTAENTGNDNQNKTSELDYGKCIYQMRLSSKSENGKLSLDDALGYLVNDDVAGKLVCFDISEFMEKSKANEFVEFLQKLYMFEDEYVFAFRIPYVEPDALEKTYKLLSDVLFMRKISVVPFTNEELKERAEKVLKDFDFTADVLSWDVFFSRIREEKTDGRFYSFQSVNKICYEMLWLKHKADAGIADEVNSDTGNVLKTNKAHSNLILPSEICNLSTTYMQQPKNGFDELSELIGMEKIVDRLKEIVAQVKVTLSNTTMERPCLHMRFVGAPGTGKTTVARIVGKIFAENGILRNGYFFEYSARDLCGEYVGQTAPKTASICRDAYGSVLFIDEAYALYYGDDRNADYGREALTTLISEMENHRSDMVVVMAGYKDDMDKLMEGNAGLRSRMPYIIEFPAYTKKQLFEIYMLMVKKHFKYEDSLEKEAEKYFESLSDSYIASADFANARFVRNLYERTWSKAAVRQSSSNTDRVVLNGADFITATADKEFSEKLMHKSVIGFMDN